MRIATFLRILCWHYSLIISISVALSANIYVWPLGKGVFNREVKQNANQGLMGDVTLGDGPPTLGYQAFGFKGYYPSYLDLKVPASSSLTADATFMFYLYLESNTAGTLFHFESDDAAASDAWTGVTVSYSSTAVMFNFYGDASSYSDESSSVALSLPTGTWVHIALERDESNGNTKFYVNGIKTDISGAPSGVSLKLPGVVRIGTSKPTNPANAYLHGRVTCFIIQDQKFKYSELSADEEDCMSSNWGIPTSAPCPSDCSSYRGYFRLIETGKKPHSMLSGIDSCSDCTSRRCADICLANTNCVSFVIWKSTGLCVIFDDDYTDYLQADTNDPKYYVRRDSCCM